MSEFESLNKTLLIKYLNSYCHHHISKTVVIKFKSRSHGWKCREAHWEDTGFHGYTSSPALSLDFYGHPAQSNYKKLKKFIPNDFQGRKKNIIWLGIYQSLPVCLSGHQISLIFQPWKKMLFHHKEETWSFQRLDIQLWVLIWCLVSLSDRLVASGGLENQVQTFLPSSIEHTACNRNTGTPPSAKEERRQQSLP